jgi:hypothetical protein
MGEQRKHKIISDYGINDYFRHYKANGGNESKKLYTKVIREFHRAIGTLLATEEYNFKLPRRLGSLCVKKEKNFVSVKEGKLITNLPVNWKATLKMWEVDEEAKLNKTCLRYENYHSNRYSYRFRYLKSKAIYKNKQLYRIWVNRKVKRQLAQLIFKYGEIDRGS